MNTSISFRSRTWLFLTFLTLLTGLTCKKTKRIVVPVCTCVVRGAVWTKDRNQNQPPPKPAGEDAYFVHQGNPILTSHVTDLVTEANDNVWIPGADINMMQVIAGEGEIPVIDDPQTAIGKYGDVVADRLDTEGEQAAAVCREKYNNSPADVLVIIIVRHLLNPNGSKSARSGFAEPYYDVERRNNGADLCNFPRNLTQEDTKRKFIIIDDPAQYTPGGEQAGRGLPHIILSHEFGHALMLSHGDGKDNNGNAVAPPTDGSRLFDSFCDRSEPEEAEPPNLMNETAGYYGAITEFQKELARTVAKLMPRSLYDD